MFERFATTRMPALLHRNDPGGRLPSIAWLVLVVLLLVGISAPADAQCGADPGDDDFATATDLGSTCAVHSAAIDCSGDLDYYTFTAPQSATFTFSVSSGNPSTPVSITLYNSSGTPVGTSETAISYTLSSGDLVWVKAESVLIGATPTYDLEVSGCSGGNCGADPGNDDVANATWFPGCAGYTAAIDCIGDLDFYEWSAPSSGSYTFETTGSTDTFLELFNGSGGLILSDDDGGAGANARIVSTVTGGQTYYVRVSEYNNDATGDYELQISGCSGGCGADPGDDTGATATFLNPGCATMSGKAIDCPGDIDFYSWTATNPGTYTFAVTPTSSMRLTLFTAAGSLIQEGPSVDYTMTAGETVHIRIMSQSSSDTPTYTLSISGCSSGGCGSDPGNDYLASATPLSGCGSTPAAIDCTGDLDYYWLTAPGSGSFTFETTGATDTELRLYDSNGDAIASDDDSGSGSNARIVYTLVAGQKYSVAVNEYGNDGTGDYTLVVSGCSSGGCGSDPGNEDTAHATDLGTSCGTTAAAIDCTGDTDFYAFTAIRNGVFTFAVSSTDTMRLTLFTAAGNLIAETTSTYDYTMSAGEKVYVRILPQDSTVTQSYDLTISGCNPSCGNDPGNDYLASATPLSGCGSTPAAIDCVGDLDYYWLTAP
ncbi:MAG: hypothetical protein GXP47_09680, partial [Acidobacteria bacterium]|nr:hypothetical protein [Acidobacteriota bacterium]